MPRRTRWTLVAAGFLVLLASVPAPLASALQNADRSGGSSPPVKAPPPESRVDINRASLDELLKIPGMTPIWAGRIVRFRPYRSKQDLLDHGVLPANIYDRIKDYVIAHRDKQ